MKTKLLCVLCSVAMLACGKSTEEHPASAESRPAPAQALAGTPQAPQADTLQIKGLYIGMDIRSVPNAMLDILAAQQLSDFSFTDVIRLGDGTQCVLMYTKPFLRAIESRMRERYSQDRAPGKVDEEVMTACANSDGVLTAKSGADNKVSQIQFNDVKDIFDAGNIPPAAFVKKLSSEHHIPEMKPNETQSAWSYTAPNGDKVEVDSKEVLGIPMVRLYMSKAGS